jgi:hypothetical protein
MAVHTTAASTQFMLKYAALDATAVATATAAAATAILVPAAATANVQPAELL